MTAPSLVIAVPSKGRLKEKAAALFEAAGYTLRVKGHERGYRGQLDGLNLVGLKRRGVSRADITALRAAFQMLAQGEGAFQDRARRLGDETESQYVREIVNFVMARSDRSFLTPGG